MAQHRRNFLSLTYLNSGVLSLFIIILVTAVKDDQKKTTIA